MSHLASNITDTGEGLTKGSLVWVRSSSSVSWQAGELRGLEGSTAQVWLKATGVVATFEASAVLPANPTIQEAIPDLTHLSYLNEPGILCNLGRRYAEDAIYTFAGPVLIALNPCKALPLYTTEVANTYKAGARDVVQAASLAPHIYLVAANAFRRMAREHASQSLIVNGESGAGKTETTKKAMQYFATLAGGTGVEGQVLETNPILEAFGNAKTLRNHNSSRFGKLIQIHFNSSLHICGACIKTYLLEKSRVVKQLPGERSYHIFYQLVRGASPTMRAALGLPTHPRSFAFLAASGCTDIEGVDDAAEFQAVCEALGDVGIDPQLQASLFQLLAGVLWLGNLQFEADPTDLGNDATLLVEDTASQAVCGLLGVSHASLSAALTQRRIVTPSEVVTKLLNEEESKDCRDALAKALYAAAFDWIVSRINLKLDTGKKGSGLSISILDIYGFEQFTTNSFEQLCINYANERLQQQFTRHLFGLEQQEYEMEGIDWTKVEFVDNQECVDAVEQVPPRGLGVLSVLDAQCRFPKATDATFLTTLKEALSGHTRFSVSSRTPREFTILHYAGAVSYDSAGFLDKNKDTLNADLVELLVGADVSVSPLVPSLGRALKEEAEANIRRGGQTVGSRFAQQLRDLVQDLDTTGLHFVRCIKPNAALKPGWFEEELALHQLRCCGVLEVARIARAGFPTRYTHQMFAERYAILLPREQQAALQEAAGGMEGHQGNALTAVRTLTEVFGLTPSQYQIGRTKVFFRPGVLGFVEDKWAAMQAAALTLQAGWRMWTLRCSYLSQRAAALRVQSLWRMRCQRRLYADLLQQTHAATIIQSKWRGHRAQVRYQAMRESAVRLQLAWRRHCFAVRVERRVQERLRIERLKKLEQDKFESLRQQYGCDLDEVRAALATWVSARAVLSQQAQEKTDSQQPDLTTAELASRLLLAQHQHPTAEGATPHQQQPLPQHQQHTTAAATTGLADSVAALLSADATPTAASDLAAATAAVSPRISSPPAVEALPPAGWLARVPDLGLASSYSMQSAGFTTALELREASERLTLENLKLEKQLQLERSLKERYQHKYEQQALTWKEQFEVLQQYLAMLRCNVGDARLPPLPSALTTAPAPPSAPPPPLTGRPSAPAAAPSSDVNGLTPALSPKPEAGVQTDSYNWTDALAASAHSSFSADSSAQGDGARRGGHKEGGGGRGQGGFTGPLATGAGPLGASRQGTHPVARDQLQASTSVPVPYPSPTPPTGHPQASRLPQPTNGAPPGSPNHTASPRPAPLSPAHHSRPTSSGSNSNSSTAPPGHHPTRGLSDGHPAQPVSPFAGSAGGQGGRPPSSGAKDQAAVRYVTQLQSELNTVAAVLEDDVSFLQEVQRGEQAVAVDLDPTAELAKLTKKFNMWHKEYEEKLRTASDVLRKMDRLQQQQQHRHAASAAQAGRASTTPMAQGAAKAASKTSGLMGKLFSAR